MRGGLAILMVLALPLPASAAGAPPHWQETLAQDIGGPRVQMTGQVEQVMRDGDYTCFVLSRLADYTQTGGGQRFLTCGPGVFGGAAFSPGALLQVTGNLGAQQPRRVAGQVLDYPMVAAPLLQPSSVVPWRYAYPDPYWGYPGYGYDPWYRPWYGPGASPYWGLQYQYWR